MKIRSPINFVIVGLFLWLGGINESKAQTNSQFTKNSEGMTLSVKKSIVHERKVTIQFQLTNNTTTRVYVLVASAEVSAGGILSSSGEHLDTPQITGVDVCVAYVVTCNNVTDLNQFSYMEPGDSITFGSIFSSQAAVADSDAVSFSVPMIALFSREDGDHSQITRKATARFNFSDIPVSHH